MMETSKLNQKKGRKQWLKRAVLFILLLSMLLAIASLFFIQKEEDKAVLRIGMECGYAPFNWTQFDSSNNAVKINGSEQYANGYDVQMMRRIAKKMNRRLEIVKVDWDGLIPALQSGQIDAIAAGMSATDERKQSVDFSNEYYYSDLVIVVKKDGPYASATQLSDFKGASLAGQQGTLHYDVIKQIEGVKKQTAVKDFPTMIVALNSGTIDGYVSERPGALSAAASDKGLTFIAFPKGQGFDFAAGEVTIGVGVKKKDPVREEINAALASVSEEEREQIMQDVIKVQPGLEDENLNFGQAVVNIIQRYWKQFLRGAGTTMLIAIAATLIGLFIGILVAILRGMPKNSKNPFVHALQSILNFLLSAYVEIFRGTPMMVQAMVFFYGFSYITGYKLPSFWAGLIIVSINTGAYMAEVVRGGIESIPKGQMEAAKAIGMTHAQAMKTVIMPQAIRNILPATGNEFVVNIKDTSVLNVISVSELFFTTKDIQTTTWRIFETYLITAVIYFVLTFTVTRILRLVEKKMDGPDNYVLASAASAKLEEVSEERGA